MVSYIKDVNYFELLTSLLNGEWARPKQVYISHLLVSLFFAFLPAFLFFSMEFRGVAFYFLVVTMRPDNNNDDQLGL